MAKPTPPPQRWTQARKTAVVLALRRGGEVAELARQHGLSQAERFSWRDGFLTAGQAALKTRRTRAVLEQEHCLQALECKVGQLTLENEILKKTDALIRPRGRKSSI